MNPGYLLVTNNVDPAAEARFNDWYQNEHLDERLSVPGFHTARRYIAVESPQRYAALYETDSVSVLQSSVYSTLLRSPTAKTTAIMPHFRDMNRVVARVLFRDVRGAGGTLAILFLDTPSSITDEQARAIGAIGKEQSARDLAPEAVRVIVAQPDNIGVNTPESKLRPGGDRTASVVVVVEWVQAEGKDFEKLRAALEAGGHKVERDRGGLYRLICARERKGDSDAA